MYFSTDTYIDATKKGNLARFCNHSHDPNCEVQMWQVDGKYRMAIYTTRVLRAGEEITFDYKAEWRNMEPQQCHCEAFNCTGWIGVRVEKPYRPRRSRKNDQTRAEQPDSSSIRKGYKTTRSKKMPYQCLTCGKEFTWTPTIHMRTHIEDKRYKCQYCEKPFYRLSGQQEHEYQHNDGWPYRCHNCKRGFAWPSKLKSHCAKAKCKAVRQRHFLTRRQHKLPKRAGCSASK
jgi:DNA-directed RNA polymerase subunit RPC12/RpoP